MKKNTMLVVCLSFLCAGCIIITDNSVAGSGNVITRSYEVQNFTDVELLGSMSAKIVQGDTFKVEVTIDDNLIDMVNVEVWEQQLKIAMKQRSSWSWGVRRQHTAYRVLITMPTMKALQVSGSATVVMEGFKDSSSYYDIIMSGSGKVRADALVAEKIMTSVKGSGSIEFKGRAKELELTDSGSGRIHADVEAEKVTAFLRGSGSIKLKGRTKELDHTLSGSGALYAFDCSASVVKVMVRGSGVTQVNAADSLDVTISGSGNVMYKGVPVKLQTAIRGSGRVHPTL